MNAAKNINTGLMNHVYPLRLALCTISLPIPYRAIIAHKTLFLSLRIISSHSPLPPFWDSLLALYVRQSSPDKALLALVTSQQALCPMTPTGEVIPSAVTTRVLVAII